ncbi:hypothetical protein QQP08_013300 [Theobroma cacao]|nr:hypothetical protein QQP08_012999 [Theobroma cacao]WRX20813.1 hypothetical protein QQP08_013300 [Theobroma cacao]
MQKYQILQNILLSVDVCSCCAIEEVGPVTVLHAQTCFRFLHYKIVSESLIMNANATRTNL